MAATQQDPTQAAFSDAAQVPDVPASGKEKAFGLIGALTTGKPKGGALDEAIQKHHQQRLDEARMHRRTASTALGIWSYGIDPKTGEKLTPEQEQQYLNEWNSAMESYQKVAGVNKETKAAIQKARQLAEYTAQQQRQKRQGGALQAQGGAQGAPPPPAPGAQPAAPAALSPAQQSAGPSGGPPQVPFAEPSFTEKEPFLRAQVIQRQAEASKQREDNAKFVDFVKRQDVEKQNKIEEIQAAADAKAKTQGTGKAKISGVHYAGPDGQPLFGWSVSQGVDPDTGKPIATLYDQEMNELPPDTHVFSAWMSPRTTTTNTWKEVQQPDGSIALVPVQTSSVTKRGGTVPPPPAPGESPKTPPTAASKVKTSPAQTMGLPKGAKIVGGKVPPGVAKAYEAFNSAQERYNVMEAALPDAQKGDQQAMLNLLANHIGMTMGLQKGSRITQAIYEEASQSAPWLSRVEAHFDDRGYLTGVVLTPEQMQQMIKLAQVRLGQDEAAWKREISAAKTGYGMGGGAATPPPPPSSSSSGSFKPF